MKTESLRDGIILLQSLGFDETPEKMLAELEQIEGKPVSTTTATPAAQPAPMTEAEFIAWLEIIGLEEALKLEACVPHIAGMPDSHHRKGGAILMREGLRQFPSALTDWMIHRK